VEVSRVQAHSNNTAISIVQNADFYGPGGNVSEPKTMTGASRKIVDIEILRALAVTFVVLHHANDNLFRRGQLFDGFIDRYLGGWVGVDLFFAISGFVIARALIPSLAAAPSPRAFRKRTYYFWGKRVFRLLPSAWGWLAIILLLQIFFNDSGVFGTFKANAWATVAGVFNFANFRFADAFMSYPYGTSFFYWSLSLEEQFYLLLPLVCFFSGRFLPVVLLVVIAVQLPQQRGLFEMAVRSDAICLGVLIALFSKSTLYAYLDPRRSKLLFAIYFLVLLAGLCLLPFLGPLLQQQSFQIGLIALLSALIVFICSFDRGFLARIPGSGLLVWLGGRSYAVYLIHIPVFFFIRELAYRNNFALESAQNTVFTGAIVLLLLLAEANYRLIETPVQKLSRRLFGSGITKT
jgi:peptidoglycan/LPS O-acetylase OafA/YrhL